MNKDRADNILEVKSLAFAIRIVNLFKYLYDQKGEDVMSKQLLSSGTSIGANVSEGTYAQSKEDFVHKYSIALKEANETRFWLRILSETGYLDSCSTSFVSLMDECVELIRMLAASVRTAKQNKS